MIKVVSFDIGGTLLKNEDNVSQSQYGLKELTKLLNLPYEKVREAYKDVFQKKKGKFNELITNFCNKLEIKSNKTIIDFFHNKFFNESRKQVILSENISLIKNLKLNGYKVILFSNSCCLLNNDAINEVLDYVNNIFYSYDIGYTKDDEESYKYIEKVMKVKPNEILHIGDTLKSDYYMPKKHGWNVLYYGSCDETDVKSIEFLTDLINILNI